MAVYFTSDTHFGHANIIRYCNRPFSSAEEMDEVLVARWNEVVRPDDQVWHLGDFSMRTHGRRLRELFHRLNGSKHLVIGNHDYDEVFRLPWSTAPSHYAETTVDGVKFVLFHYGMRVWNGNFRGSLHLYGHSHSRLPGNRRSLDVGVDAWDFRPVGADAIRARMATLPDIDPETGLFV